VIRRAVRTTERRTGLSIPLGLAELPEHAPLATKIVLFRTLEEALSNAVRHGHGIGMSVRARLEGDLVAVCVADEGPGFRPDPAIEQAHLGLANCRERAELLGGRLDVESAPGAGARVWIRLPLREARTTSPDDDCYNIV
jgi:signal transduction histidine kinase